MENIKQVSLINTGLLFEYVEDGQYQYLYINDKQSEEILAREINASNHIKIDDVDDIIFFQDLIKSGYFIRQYDNKEGQLSYKCGKLYLYLDDDKDEDYIKDVMSQAQMLGIHHVVLVGDVFQRKDFGKIVVFCKNNGFYCSIQSNCSGYDRINTSFLEKVDNILIESKNVSTTMISQLTQFLYNKNIPYTLITEDNDYEYEYGIYDMKIDSCGDVYICDVECNDNIADNNLGVLWADLSEDIINKLVT